MNTWLVKSEPGCWSFADHMAKGVERWDGVRNHQAAANLKAMRCGDLAFFYHSVDEKRVVGVLEVVREAYPDPTDPAGRFVCVDFKAVAPLPRPVTLAGIKADPRLAHLALLKQSRLSVVPIDAGAWAVICALGGLDHVGA
ncbi:EVE domain-containing protein [Novispirillum sp. DQ9]|uniref:EVE domain-containing protein n=1 Tax=Novispirillum sp. DQ9 TaxID=3398612 RepID=UPI003C7A93F0